MLACRPSDTDAAADTLWLDPAGGRGAITAATSEADLVRRFGAPQVRRGEIALAEGDAAPGTTLFPDDSTRLLEVVWRDSAARARPDFVRVAGRFSRWMVTPGVRLGMTLAELERMNAGPFTLTGADPNTGALTVLSWSGGRLSNLSKGPARVWIQLAPPESADVPEALQEAETDGGRELPSSHPVVRRLNPRVNDITLGFGVPADDPADAAPAVDTSATGAVAFSGPLRLVKRELTVRNRPGRTPEFEVTAQYPEIVGSGEAGVVGFNRAMRALVDTLTAGMRKEATGPDAVGGEQHVDYVVEMANDALVSVHFTDYFRYEGAGQSNALSRTVTWDLRRGRRLRLDELFSVGPDLERVVSDRALRELKRLHAGEAWATDERLGRSVGHVVGDEDKWLVNARGLALVFDSAEIGPPGAAATTVEIPYAALLPFVRRDGPLARLVP